MKLADLSKIAQANAAEFIDLKFSDLLGTWHHITLPIESLNEELFTTGVGVDGSSMPGFSRIESGDMIMLPDPTTVFMDPFFERPTISFIGDIMESADTILPYSRNPRRVAGDAERAIERFLPGISVILGPEFEFYVFDKVNFYQGAESAFYHLDSLEAEWSAAADEESLGFKIPFKKGYHIGPPMDRTFNLRSDIAQLLAAVGVNLKYHHHEVGAGGQHEIEIQFAKLSKMADQAMLVKYIIKNHCFRNKKSATFMPKPLFNEPGSGLHVHQYLADESGSIFYDKNHPTGLSETCLHYIGGLLKHVDAILAFTNPSTNSFKRLIPGFEAPVAGTYAIGNRTACIRIPGYERNPKRVRFEFRPPDGTMNPYLAFAAMVMAGLDGIRNKIDPGLPLDRNLDTMTADELSEIHQLPTSLTKALDSLEVDNEFLLAEGVFTPDLIENWIAIKRQEVDQIRVRPTPHEFALYYNI